MTPTRLHAIMSGEARDLKARLARLAMSCAEPLYRGAVAVRNAMFDWGIRKSKKLPRPVISIGNITTGGTGKTPMVIEIVRRLMALGQRPAVLLRGYGMDEVRELDEAIGGRPTDEALARLSENVREIFDGDAWGVPICPQSNRYRAGSGVIAQMPRVTAFVLDDGFQHRQLHRDLNLLLIDAMEPFGYGRVLPRGMLRESLRNMGRADAVIVTRADRVDAAALKALDQTITRIAGRSPVAHVAHRWTGFNVYARHLIERMPAPPAPGAPTSRTAGLDALRQARVVAACGIGNPEAFGQMLTSHVGTLANLHVFGDHHDYTLADVVRVFDDAGERKADAIVVTPKDYVKWLKFLPPFAPDRDSLPAQLRNPLAVYRPALAIQFIDGGEAVDGLLRACIGAEGLSSGSAAR